MKKLTAFILAMLLACTAVVGCEKDEPLETPIETTQSETPSQTEEVIKDYDQDDSQQGFSIKGKRYYYKGNDYVDTSGEYPAGEVLLLNVTNETDTNYTATLTVTYQDENGETIKTERQTFKQFAAGYQRYFLFSPQKSYASYTCVLSLEEYTEEIFADRFSFHFEGLRELKMPIVKLANQGDYTLYPSIEIRFSCTEQSHPVLTLSRMFVLFDNNGEIYLIEKLGNKKTTTAIGHFSTAAYQTTEKKLSWPEELTGELECIFIFDILE